MRARAALLILAAVALVAAVLMYRHGVRPDRFPAYAEGTDHTMIVRYSGPWLAGAAGALLVALVCVSGLIVLVSASRFPVARRFFRGEPGRKPVTASGTVGAGRHNGLVSTSMEILPADPAAAADTAPLQLPAATPPDPAPPRP